MMEWKIIQPEELNWNPFIAIGREWILVSAGNESGRNLMTASWGGLGVFWGKNAATIYIRQNRYTKEFIDKDGKFTLSLMGPEYRKALAFCGSVTGRGRDKFKEAGLTPMDIDGSTAPSEARTILVCRSMYSAVMTPDHFLDPDAQNKWYDGKTRNSDTFHTQYIAEIEKILTK